MKKANLISVLFAGFVGLYGVSAVAESVPLERPQLEALLRGGVAYTVILRPGPVEFEFHENGKWSARTPKGREAWGKWRLQKNKLCRSETGNDGLWSGFKKKSVCFAFKTDGTQLYLGAKNLLVTIGDQTRLARLQGAGDRQSRPAVAQADPAKDRLEKEHRDLELKRLALEKQRLLEAQKRAEIDARERAKLEADNRELERMRIDLEKEKLQRERATLEQQEGKRGVAKEKARDFPDIDFGAYHAVVIGINDYESLPKLNTALIDARAVAQTLEELYGYRVHFLENPTRADILDKFDELRETLTEDDNLLIYYAGHGWLDTQSGRGYWLPSNARSDRRSRWFSNSDLTDALQALFAKHVMVVADSCFSGTLTRSIKVPGRSPDYIARMAEKRTRVVLSSGGLEPVTDSGGGKHSIFAAQFLNALRNNQDVLDGTQLFNVVRKNVVLNADQTPQYSDIRRAGHEGGDFLFVRKK